MSYVPNMDFRWDMSLENAQQLSSVVDCDELLTRCLNNLAFAERMLALFQNRCGEDLSELEAALDAGDMERVRRVAHKLAGASANAAAFGLQARAADLRHAACDSSLDHTRQCLTELQGEWLRFNEALSTDQASLKTS